jgi:hypothetical protein
MGARIPIDREKIAEFCRRWKITEFALFGSVLTFAQTVMWRCW